MPVTAELGIHLTSALDKDVQLNSNTSSYHKTAAHSIVALLLALPMHHIRSFTQSNNPQSQPARPPPRPPNPTCTKFNQLTTSRISSMDGSPEPVMPLPTQNRLRHHDHSNRRSSTRSSSTADHRPGGLKNCASAFYSHPPTSISLDQIESSRQVPTLASLGLPKDAACVLIKAVTPNEADAGRKSWLVTAESSDSEAQSTRNRVRGCWCGRLTGRHKIIFRILIVVVCLAIAVAVGVGINMGVNGSIQWNTKGRGW